jgi:hypothetical protein
MLIIIYLFIMYVSLVSYRDCGLLYELWGEANELVCCRNRWRGRLLY